jgi:hypothetical protein
VRQCESTSNHRLTPFDFGILSGTMLLSLSKDSLHAFAEERTAEQGSDSDSDTESESRYAGMGDSKRKRTSGDAKPSPSFRRRLGEAPKPNRVQSRWVGASVPENELDGPMDDRTIVNTWISRRPTKQWRMECGSTRIPLAVMRKWTCPSTRSLMSSAKSHAINGRIIEIPSTATRIQKWH